MYFIYWVFAKIDLSSWGIRDKYFILTDVSRKKIYQTDREKYKIIHFNQIKQARSQHYYILNLSFLSSSSISLIFYFFYLIFLSLSFFNLNILSALSLSLIFFFKKNYSIFYLFISFILNSLSIDCKLGLHEFKYK